MSKKQKVHRTLPIYVYDRRTLMGAPVFIVYDEKHVEPVARMLLGAEGMPFIEVSRVRLHAYEARDSYRDD